MQRASWREARTSVPFTSTHFLHLFVYELTNNKSMTQAWTSGCPQGFEEAVHIWWLFLSDVLRFLHPSSDQTKLPRTLQLRCEILRPLHHQGAPQKQYFWMVWLTDLNYIKAAAGCHKYNAPHVADTDVGRPLNLRNSCTLSVFRPEEFLCSVLIFLSVSKPTTSP